MHTDERTQARKEGFAIAWSLAIAIQEAGGSIKAISLENMTLEDFICMVAPNGIRFVCEKKDRL